MDCQSVLLRRAVVGVLGNSTYCQSNAASNAPRIGPTQYATCPSHCPATSAGPNARAGFIAAPVSGPPTRISNSSTSPIPNPANSRRIGRHRRPEHRGHEEERQDQLDAYGLSQGHRAGDDGRAQQCCPDGGRGKQRFHEGCGRTCRGQLGNDVGAAQRRGRSGVSPEARWSRLD